LLKGNKQAISSSRREHTLLEEDGTYNEGKGVWRGRGGDDAEIETGFNGLTRKRLDTRAEMSTVSRGPVLMIAGDSEYNSFLPTPHPDS